MDLEKTLRSIVSVQATIPEDAFTAPILGAERAGGGVVIRESGVVLTIGYLITEAEKIWLTPGNGRAVPAHALAYDQETGFGLVQALGRLDLPALELGNSGALEPGQPVTVAGARGQAVQAAVVSRREFAGYWEYLLDDAIFTAPAHPLWGGAGLIGPDGKLLGIGSLMLQMASGREVQDINMMVPIDLLKPILGDMLRYGQVQRPARPWLGIYSAENDGKVVVLDVDRRGPGAGAGLRQGDVVMDVRDQSVEGLADFYRKVWGAGPAGSEITLRVLRAGREMWVRVKSADRDSFLRKPVMQ
ncbi:MAG: serine protease [Rhizobiales bacterium]|nr:serine protease [Hyphomicrobiales bacterium]